MTDLAFEYAARAFTTTATEIPKPAAWASPLDLAEALNPFATIRTPALELINAAVVKCLATPGGRLAISLPPQEGKSYAVTRPVPLWLYLTDPALRLGVACYSQELAEEFGGGIRDWIAENDGTHDTIDLGLRISRDSKAKRYWSIAGHMGRFMAVGMQSGTLTGRALDGLIIDDPFGGSDDADSKSFRDSVWSFWTGKAIPRLPPAAWVIVIQTRWHEDDFIGRLAAGPDANRWRIINIPAQADHNPAKGETDPLGREVGEYLQSARGRTPADWESRKIELGTRMWNALCQGRPSPELGDVWKRPWWGRYDTPAWSIQPDGTYRTDADDVILTWDMAFKDTKGSDYVVGQVLGRWGAEVKLLDQVRRRMTFTQTVAAFKHQADKWPQASKKLVEDKANGTAVIDTLRKKVPGIKPVTPHESKYARANAVAPFIEAHNVQLPDPSIALFNVDEFLDEVSAFPNGSHDDQVDAFSQGLGEMYLGGAGATEWTAYLKRQAQAIAAEKLLEPLPGVADLSPLEAARQAAFTAHR